MGSPLFVGATLYRLASDTKECRLDLDWKSLPVTVASDLLQRHIETLLTPGEWEALIADNIIWGSCRSRQRSGIRVGSKDARQLRST